jgi:UDP-N-acetylglucosamine--N-acetylmuramyl-(pentapeptide) pyrophosphoryl-undecaprenol N-acetylglucosamine transferase
MGTRVVIMAGGTGGHVYPALAVAHELRARGCEVTWMGTLRGLEARVVPAAGVTLDALSISGIRGKGWRQRLAGPLQLSLACAQAFRILRLRRPGVVVGFGGFVAGPGGLVSRVLGIPLLIHEQNCVPGTTNRWLAKIARRVLEAFPGSFPSGVRAECTGNPLRRDLTELPSRPMLSGVRPARILIFGGSLGAKALNEMVPAALHQLGRPCEIRHQTGEAMCAQTAAAYRSLGLEAEVSAFIDDMAGAYCWADLAICRAGAMTVSELAAVGLPAILIPYPHAIDDHQTANARFFATRGAGICLSQDALSVETLAEQISDLMRDSGRLNEMGRCARALARTDAAERVADACLAEVAN